MDISAAGLDSFSKKFKLNFEWMLSIFIALLLFFGLFLLVIDINNNLGSFNIQVGNSNVNFINANNQNFNLLVQNFNDFFVF